MNTATAATATPATDSPTAAAPEERVYVLSFWLAYAANVSLVTANALTFRFAEFVAWLGGSEQLSGTIVSTGVTAALVARFLLGQGIDRYGVKLLWMVSTVVMMSGVSLFPLCNELNWLVYAGRIAFAIGLAGMFTCSMVHIQNQVPAHRRTEVIGMLGTSGFLGMVCGTQLGDAIFNHVAEGRSQFLALFGTAAGMGLFYLTIVFILTRHDRHTRPAHTPAAHQLLLKYWPGPVMFVAIMLGVGFTVTTVFLTRFSTANGLGGIGTFFTGYSISAFCFRLASRRWSRRYGRHLMIVIGLAGQATGLLLLPHVSANWQFLLPAFGCGLGHALLFPSVISLGSGAFPQELRGSGTTITLGFTELGALLSAPLLGTVIDYAGFSAMFYTAAFSGVTVGVYYALTRLSCTDEEAVNRPSRRTVVRPASTASDQPATPITPVPSPAQRQPALACCGTQPRSVDGSSLDVAPSAAQSRPQPASDDENSDDSSPREPRPDESIAWPFPQIGRNA